MKTTYVARISATLVLSLSMAWAPVRVLGRGFSQASAAAAFVRPGIAVSRKEVGNKFSGTPVFRALHAPAFSTEGLGFSQRLGVNLGAASGGNNGSRNQGHSGAAPNRKNNSKQGYPQRRYWTKPEEAWVVPKSIDIPVEKIDLSFSRSSGAGGQNVNKVNTKVELRFHVLEAEWIPLEVRQRLYEQQRGRISKKGILSIQSQEFRTQDKNRKAAVSKLREMILGAYPRPKERKMRKGVSKAAKERNKEFKKRRSQAKQSRSKVTSRDW